ncbi:hypothetical protein [Thermomonospora umbrina]|uniref:MFS transporter n=1 Tax=Thermomonospora umbrina TaxID=111806 RepID=A0A3D9SI64_9ACTN|nr:hypothetical protein [Thermomonospora umbrina]REE95592.1 hypothetical protein DFJ69_0989 [Thermomonospora umbrina]
MSTENDGPRGAHRLRRLAAVAVWPVVLLALPVAGAVIPNTMQYVVALGHGPGGGRDLALIRAAGLALPALLVTLPIAAVLVRRVRACLVVVAGVAGVLAGTLAVEAVDTVWQAGVARAAQGAGAGLILPATLALVWDRRNPAFTAAWAGTLTAVLMMAMPPALRAVPLGDTPGEDAWREVLQPYPGYTAFALAVAVVGGFVLARARSTLPTMRHTERTQLLLPLAPAAGFAALAVISTYGWRPETQLLVAGLAFAALLGLALVGSRDRDTGSPFGSAVAFLALGLLAFPVAAPLTGLLGATHGPQDIPLWPFACGGAASVLGALASVRLAHRGARGVVAAGHGLAIIAVLLFLTVDAGSAHWLLAVPPVLLGGGLGLALAASLRDAGPGAALFGLTLCLPAVLTGQIAVSSLQSLQLRRLGLITTQEQLLYGLTSGYRVWLIAAGVLSVLLLGVVARLAAPHGAHGATGRRNRPRQAAGRGSG